MSFSPSDIRVRTSPAIHHCHIVLHREPCAKYISWILVANQISWNWVRKVFIIRTVGKTDAIFNAPFPLPNIQEQSTMINTMPDSAPSWFTRAQGHRNNYPRFRFYTNVTLNINLNLLIWCAKTLTTPVFICMYTCKCEKVSFLNHCSDYPKKCSISSSLCSFLKYYYTADIWKMWFEYYDRFTIRNIFLLQQISKRNV